MFTDPCVCVCVCVCVYACKIDSFLRDRHIYPDVTYVQFYIAKSSNLSIFFCFFFCFLLPREIENERKTKRLTRKPKESEKERENL